jgi:hypothetical protein
MASTPPEKQVVSYNSSNVQNPGLFDTYITTALLACSPISIPLYIVGLPTKVE